MVRERWCSMKERGICYEVLSVSRSFEGHDQEGQGDGNEVQKYGEDMRNTFGPFQYFDDIPPLDGPPVTSPNIMTPGRDRPAL